MMRIFILGAGYIGRVAIEWWSDPQDIFWASTTTESKLSTLEQAVERAFLLKAEENKLSEIVEECNALIICVAPLTYTQYKETYLDTAHHVQKAIERRKEPLFVLYTSSTSVYGDHQGAIVDEKARRLNQTPTNHIHRDDIARAIEFCVKHRCEGIYNLAGDNHPRRSQLYGSICQKLGIPIPKWDSSQLTEHGSNIRVSNKKNKKTGFVFNRPLA